MKKAYIAFTWFIVLLCFSAYSHAQEFKVSIKWTHSGRGMDKFVFQHAPTDTGTWSFPINVMIADLTPKEIDGEKHWETVITIEADSYEEIRWWRCYAETSYDKQSAISEPSQSVRINPNRLRVII